MYLLGLSAVVPLLNWDVTVSMVELWQGSAYEHCYLIPFVTAYILWRENEASQSLDWNGSLFGLMALLLSMIFSTGEPVPASLHGMLLFFKLDIP